MLETLLNRCLECHQMKHLMRNKPKNHAEDFLNQHQVKKN